MRVWVGQKGNNLLSWERACRPAHNGRVSVQIRNMYKDRLAAMKLVQGAPQQASRGEGWAQRTCCKIAAAVAVVFDHASSLHQHISTASTAHGSTALPAQRSGQLRLLQLLRSWQHASWGYPATEATAKLKQEQTLGSYSSYS